VTRYLLDTNIVSDALKAHPAVMRQLTAVPMASLCISAITEGELLSGLARRPDAVRLHALVEEFLSRVDVLPWNRASAACYGSLGGAGQPWQSSGASGPADRGAGTSCGYGTGEQ